jgi:hypothetical protein
MTHLLEFVNHCGNATGPDQQNLVGQSTGDITGEFLSRQQFFGKDGVFGQDKADSSV